jgi:hypothetical protein
VALATLNDVITREAFSRGLPLLDLRLCWTRTRTTRTRSSLRPGRAKIAAAIAELVAGRDRGRRRSEVLA